MAERVLYNAGLLINGRNISGAGVLSRIAARIVPEAKALRCMGNTVVKHLNGAPHFEVDAECYAEWGSGLVGTVLQAKTGITAADGVMTAAERLVAGDEALILKDRIEKLEHGSEWNEPNALKFAVKNANRGIWGTQIFHGAVAGASGNGAGYLIGDVASGETFFALLQVYAWGGVGTITFVLERDNNENHSSPIAYHTFGVVNADAATEWVEKTNTTTDSWWRLAWTSTDSATASVNCVVGIVT